MNTEHTKHTPTPWTLEREVYVGKLGMDPTHLAVEVQSNGYTIGYWIDCEWDGRCPNIEMIQTAVNAHDAHLAVVEAASQVLNNLVDAGAHGPDLGDYDGFPRDEQGDPWYHDLWALRAALALADKDGAE